MGNFCDGFPYKRAKETHAWGLPTPVVDRAVAIYIDGESRTLDGLPSKSTNAERDEWCLRAFAVAVDIATKEALRGDIDLPRGPKTTPGGAPPTGTRPFRSDRKRTLTHGRCAQRRSGW